MHIIHGITTIEIICLVCAVVFILFPMVVVVIRKMVKCPWKKKFVNWETCAYHCKYNGGYDEQYSMKIWCSYPTLRKGRLSSYSQN